MKNATAHKQKEAGIKSLFAKKELLHQYISESVYLKRLNQDLVYLQNHVIRPRRKNMRTLIANITEQIKEDNSKVQHTIPLKGSNGEAVKRGRGRPRKYPLEESKQYKAKMRKLAKEREAREAKAAKKKGTKGNYRSSSAGSEVREAVAAMPGGAA